MERIALETLNLIKCSEARIKVQNNLCGFLLATIELKSETRGNFFLNFADFEPLEVPATVHHNLSHSDFSNPIDLCRLNLVIIDEELQGDDLPETWNFLKQNAPSISRNPYKALRKLGCEDENPILPEKNSVKEPSPEKNCFRGQNSNLDKAGFPTCLEEEKTTTRERNSDLKKRKRLSGSQLIPQNMDLLILAIQVSTAFIFK